MPRAVYRQQWILSPVLMAVALIVAAASPVTGGKYPHAQVVAVASVQSAPIAADFPCPWGQKEDPAASTETPEELFPYSSGSGSGSELPAADDGREWAAVEEGDTWSSLALQYFIAEDRLLHLNSLTYNEAAYQPAVPGTTLTV